MYSPKVYSGKLAWLSSAFVILASGAITDRPPPTYTACRNKGIPAANPQCASGAAGSFAIRPLPGSNSPNFTNPSHHSGWRGYQIKTKVFKCLIPRFFLEGGRKGSKCGCVLKGQVVPKISEQPENSS